MNLGHHFHHHPAHPIIKSALLAVANGSEDIETVTIIDVLRRGGVPLTIAKVFETFSTSPKEQEIGAASDLSDNLKQVLMQKTSLIADCTIEQMKNEQFDMIILPGGGKGAETFSQSDTLRDMLEKQQNEKRFIAAICASPALVLVPFGILKHQLATCYPSMQNQLKNLKAVKEPVVIDENLITSQGPGTAAFFALKLLELLQNKAEAKKVSKAMLIDYI